MNNNLLNTSNVETATAVLNSPADSLWHQIHELESLTDGYDYLTMIRALCLSDESIRADIAAQCDAGLREYDASIEGQREGGN